MAYYSEIRILRPVGSSARSRRKGTQGRGRQSDHYVAYLVMGYLVRRKENGERGCAPFHLTTRIPNLRTQRQDRIQDILDLMENSGYVKASKYPRATYYEITDKGMEWYKTAAKLFFAPFLTDKNKP